MLFLDDLQWVDAASLQLLEQWVSDVASHHLLVIGAYRDNEVGPSHPLTLSLSGLRDMGCDLYTIHLTPLGSSAVAQLAADTFSENPARLQFLADVIIRKSAGNPFFLRRLLHLMHAQGLFRFVSDSRRWTWDESEIERAPISDNVLDLMVLAIGRLPPPAKRLLETGACIGYRFELSTLAELTDLSPMAVTEQIWPAIEDGLVVPAQNTYNLARRVASLDEGTGPGQATLEFAHDRVQQAAYGLLSEHNRQALHHAIGRRLLDRAGDDLDAKLFEIVDQFDLGEAHVVDAAERDSLIELNLAAGRKAKASAAYRAAFEYLTVARRHLPERAWDDRLDLTFTVHRELAESAYLAGEHATAEELVETSLGHASSKVAKAELYGLRVLAATVAGDWTQALRWGREGLAVFGLEWPLEGLADAIAAEAAAVMKNLGTRKIEDLIDEPDVEDAGIRASMDLLSLLGAPAYFSGADVLTFIVSRAVNLSLIHGPSQYSAFAYVFYGGIHNTRTGQYDIGYAFGKLALAMAHRFGNRAEECRTVEVFGVLVHHWKAPLRDGLPLLKEGFRAGVESGETAFAAFNLNSVLINGLPSGLPLKDLLADAEIALDFARTQKNRTSAEIALPFRQIARALTGVTSRPEVFDDQEFCNAQFLEQARNHETALGHHWVTRLQLAYLMGDYESALECSREAAKRIPTGILGMITSAEHVFYTALTVAAATPSATDDLHALHGKLVNWATHCPQNFAHKAALVGAELASLERRPGEASVLYRAAIDEAERQRFIQDEALAHELRARFLLGEREPAFAAVHVRLARDRYRAWGATVKAAALEREFPECFPPEPSTIRRGNSIDEMALIKASQAISVETTPERLFEQILRVVVEVAGAQRGALALTADGALKVHARIEAADEVSVCLAEVPLEQCIDLPSAIFRYVLRTRESLLLSDAAAAGMFARDPVVQQRKVRSVLCVPLVKQSALVGLIYLENNAMAGAFAAELAEVGQVLAAQAVISLENCTLLEKLQQLTGALEERVADRTRQLTDEIAARDKAEMALRQADQQKDEFLAMLAHELRNPLAPIAQAGEILTRMLGDSAPAQPIIGMIKRQATHLTRLVDDLLDVSRVTQGRIQLDRRPVELASIITQATETVEPQLREKRQRLSITTSMSNEALYVNGDFARLVQCVVNLLTNSVKYTDPGGEIQVSVRDEDSSVVIEVADTGVGISPDLLPRVFDLFVQGDRTLDRAQGGLGIGLAIVKRLIQMHEGRISACSEGVGQGATFEIRLPRVARPQASGSKTASVKAPPRRVLVVDDNEDAANSLAVLLTMQGHETEAVYSGRDALKRVESFKPDVAILDIGLPEMTGYELARRLRARPELNGIRLLALTGYGQTDDRQRTKAAGFDDHLVKPVDLPALERTLAGIPMG